MSETTRTTTAQRAVIVGQALEALGRHIADYSLPEPGSIEFAERQVEFSIAGTDAAVWQASLGQGGVDVIKKQPSPDTDGVEYVTITGRLPDSGVQVAIDWVAFNATPVNYLHAVTR